MEFDGDRPGAFTLNRPALLGSKCRASCDGVVVRRAELPYSAAVVVERFEEHDSGALSIGAYIAVERESQKAIVIGRGGQRIKELGVAARVALGELFGCAVHLSLLVKIAPAWTTADAAIRRFGYRGDS